jgi:hypothetical protein
MLPLSDGICSDAVSHAGILSCYVALPCQGKSDFEAINGFREDACFAESPGLERAPSEGILRQRMNAFAADYKAMVEAAAIEFLRRSQAPFTPLDNGLCYSAPENSSRKGLAILGFPFRKTCGDNELYRRSVQYETAVSSG